MHRNWLQYWLKIHGRPYWLHFAAYDVEYKEMNDNNWQKLQFIGQIPSATLKNLKRS